LLVFGTQAPGRADDTASTHTFHCSDSVKGFTIRSGGWNTARIDAFGAGAACASQFLEAGSGGGGAGSSHVDPSATSASISSRQQEVNAITITPHFGPTEPGSEPPESGPPDGATGSAGPGGAGPGSRDASLLAFTGGAPIRMLWVGACFVVLGLAVLKLKTRRR
jgi:hypothetical protein